jgi:HEAT repeat protein
MTRPVALSCAGAFLGLVAAAAAGPAPAVGPPISTVAAPEKRTEPASIVTVKDGQLSVRVHNRPLESILEEISRQGRIAIIRDARIGRRVVSVQLQDLPLEEGLRQILRNHDAFFFYGVEGKAPASLRAVWVYPKGRGRGLQPVPPETWASTRELEGRLGDPDAGVRVRAVQALVERQGDQARDAVLEALRDPDDPVRIRALYQAVHAGVQLPTDVLAELAAGDLSPDVRFLALEALAAGPEARSFAEAALNDASPHVRGKAQQILRGLDTATRKRQ